MQTKWVIRCRVIVRIHVIFLMENEKKESLAAYQHWPSCVKIGKSANETKALLKRTYVAGAMNKSNGFEVIQRRKRWWRKNWTAKNTKNRCKREKSLNLNLVTLCWRTEYKEGNSVVDSYKEFCSSVEIRNNVGITFHFMIFVWVISSD